MHISIEDAREDAEHLWNGIDIKNPEELRDVALKLEDTKKEMQRKADSKIAEVVQKMRERLQKQIHDKTEPLTQAIKKWEAFQAEYREEISAIEESKKSDLLNKMVDLRPLIEEVRSGTAEVKQNLPLRSSIDLDVEVEALLASCVAEERPMEQKTSAPFLEQLTRVAGTALKFSLIM